MLLFLIQFQLLLSRLIVPLFSDLSKMTALRTVGGGSTLAQPPALASAYRTLEDPPQAMDTMPALTENGQASFADACRQ